MSIEERPKGREKHQPGQIAVRRRETHRAIVRSFLPALRQSLRASGSSPRCSRPRQGCWSAENVRELPRPHPEVEPNSPHHQPTEIDSRSTHVAELQEARCQPSRRLLERQHRRPLANHECRQHGQAITQTPTCRQASEWPNSWSVTIANNDRYSTTFQMRDS